MNRWETGSESGRSGSKNTVKVSALRPTLPTRFASSSKYSAILVRCASRAARHSVCNSNASATRQRLGQDVTGYASALKIDALAGLGKLLKKQPKATGAMVARIAAVGVWLLLWVATPSAEIRWIDIEQSTVTVYVSASGVRPAAAAGHVIEATLAEGSVNDTDTPHLALVMNVGQLRVVDPGRAVDERQKVRMQMLGPEGLDAERFSRITYHSLAIDRRKAGVWQVQGELEMHGRFLPLNVRAVRQGDRFTGTTTVVPTDFGISPMRVAGASALVGNEVRVDFEIVLEAP